MEGAHHVVFLSANFCYPEALHAAHTPGVITKVCVDDCLSHCLSLALQKKRNWNLCLVFQFQKGNRKKSCVLACMIDMGKGREFKSKILPS